MYDHRPDVHGDRRRDRRSGRGAAPRFAFGRLTLLIVYSLAASVVVAIAMHKVFPPETAAIIEDPGFDAAAFYEQNETARATRGMGRASVPGQPGDAPLAQPKPVAGLNQAQTNNAYIIVEVGRQMNLPRKAYVIAIATALQESTLRNLANPTVPASLKLPNEGQETNYDSLGLFQQRPSSGWGTPAQLMDPAQASARFYAKLMRITNWQNLSIAGAAQAVQRSAFPGAYAKHAERADKIVAGLP